MDEAVVRALPAAAPARGTAPVRLAGTPLRLVSRASRWLGRSLGRRFVVMSLGLLLVVQLTSFVAITVSLNHHAFRALPAQVAMGARTIERLVSWRAETLLEGARLLASDFGFRSAVLSNDRETIASVLSNHGARIGASGVTLLSVDFKVVAGADATDTADTADAGALGDPVLIARLAAQATRRSGASEIAVVGGVPRQLVLVPIKAPTLVGWVLISFVLPLSVVDEVYKLSAADLTVLSRQHPSQPWSVALSRLNPALAAELAKRPWSDAATNATDQHMSDIQVGQREFGVHALWLTRVEPAGGAPGQGDHPQVMALLSVSVDEALRPPRDLQIALLVTTLLGFLAFGLGSAYTARRITTPLQALAGAAERLGSGDSVTPIRSVRGHDEVHELAQAFEQMRISLADKQEQIVQSEKLASIGQLAAGVAHEINNPIGFVFSNFGTLEDYLARLFKMLAAYREEEAALAGGPGAQRLARLRDEIELDYLHEDIPALMSESRDGISRVRKIVQDLKDFSHVDTRQEWETVDLHLGLDSTLNIVSNEIKYKADVVKAYGTLPPVECLPNELNQVFMNLLVNAAHAIGEQRGTITLRTGVAEGGVWVEVQDNGSGIERDNLKRIFDPFFTTKPVGKGTGLGLSLSYGIVKKHGGRIEVASEPGHGATFRVWVPVRRGGAGVGVEAGQR